MARQIKKIRGINSGSGHHVIVYSGNVHSPLQTMYQKYPVSQHFGWGSMSSPGLQLSYALLRLYFEHRPAKQLAPALLRKFVSTLPSIWVVSYDDLLSMFCELTDTLHLGKSKKGQLLQLKR